MRDIKHNYYIWLLGLVDCKHERYGKLLSFLDGIEFTYILDMDGNRYEDGIYLRYRFGHTKDISQAEIAAELDNRPCSVLEMMVALAVRCEEEIMSNSNYGDRTYIWFMEMISSLGLEDMTDDNFDEEYVETIVHNLLKRDYAKDGRGGLFTIPYCEHDLREVEIWYQAMWYLSEIQDDE